MITSTVNRMKNTKFAIEKALILGGKKKEEEVPQQIYKSVSWCFKPIQNKCPRKPLLQEYGFVKVPGVVKLIQCYFILQIRLFQQSCK
jgi:hypothetical protein